MPNRREFLRRAALAAAGVPLLGCVSPSRATPGAKKRLGFALVGLGSLSTNQIAPALAKTAYCRLAAIVTGTPAKAAQWQARYGIPARNVYSYETMGRLAENADVDVVYMVTPNALHARDTIAAARAGKHVLCEKPMEVSVERCEAMIRACRDAGRQLAIGYRCQFEPHHLECVRLARQGELGALTVVEAGFGFRIGDPTQWRLNRALAGGGPLMDVGIYAIQSARMLTGEEPVEVSAQTQPTTDPVKFRDVEESISWELRFPSGLVATGRASYSSGFNGFTARAARGSFGMEPAYNYSGNRGWRSDGRPLAYPEIDQFAAEMDAFAEGIMNGTPTRVPGEEGLRDVRIMMAIYEAAGTGRPVRLA